MTSNETAERIRLTMRIAELYDLLDEQPQNEALINEQIDAAEARLRQITETEDD